MFEKLFFSKYVECILFFLYVNKKSYGRELSEHFSISNSVVQNVLHQLEDSNLLIGIQSGKTKNYEFNKKYYFYTNFFGLIEKAYKSLPKDKQDAYVSYKRKRPRKSGKPL